MQESRTENLLALPQVEDGGDGIGNREKDGCTLVGNVDIQAAED